MKVSLNIENDKELRAYIKDCIKGQVLSVVREEILETVKSELERKMIRSNGYNFEYMVKESLTQVVTTIVRREHNIKSWSTDFIQPVIEKVVTDAIKEKDWKKLIDEEAKRQIRLLL